MSSGLSVSAIPSAGTSAAWYRRGIASGESLIEACRREHVQGGRPGRLAIAASLSRWRSQITMSRSLTARCGRSILLTFP